MLVGGFVLFNPPHVFFHSTCHVILEERIYKTLPNPEEDEEDMLDLAIGLTKTSRLGCQVIVKPEMDGMIVKLPEEVANMQS